MKKKIMTLAAVLMTMGLLFAACGKKEPQMVVLTMPSNPTTGFTWEVTQTEDIFTITSEYTEDAPDQEITGAGGTETFTLTPKTAGETEVTATYRRDWEGGEVDTTVTYTFKVDKKMQIELLSGTGELSGDENSMNNPPQMEIR